MDSTDYQNSTSEKIKISVSRNLPHVAGRIVQVLLHTLFNTARFIGSLFREALGK